MQAERERAREADQREKEELEERLREKDAASTKKVDKAFGCVISFT
jgi:pre-mRNA-splicing factor ATP-dependent RNA helicase DHX16